MIAELSKLYFERTGASPQYSFEAFQDILDHPEKYFDNEEKQ